MTSLPSLIARARSELPYNRLVQEMADELERRCWKTMESAPKDGTWFLAWVPEFEYMAWDCYEFCCWSHHTKENENGEWVPYGDGYWASEDTSDAIEPAYWLPLPPKPSAS